MLLSSCWLFAPLQQAGVVLSQALREFGAGGRWGQIDGAIRPPLPHPRAQDPVTAGAAKVVAKEGCEPHPEGSADAHEDRLFAGARKKLELTAAHAPAEVGRFRNPLGFREIAVRRMHIDGTHDGERA
jgi:hypothetical protein